MPAELVRKIAEKKGIPAEEAERLWDKSKKITQDQTELTESDGEKYWRYVVGVFKNATGSDDGGKGEKENRLIAEKVIRDSHGYLRDEQGRWAGPNRHTYGQKGKQGHEPREESSDKEKKPQHDRETSEEQGVAAYLKDMFRQKAKKSKEKLVNHTSLGGLIAVGLFGPLLGNSSANLLGRGIHKNIAKLVTKGKVRDTDKEDEKELEHEGYVARMKRYYKDRKAHWKPVSFGRRKKDGTITESVGNPFASFVREEYHTAPAEKAVRAARDISALRNIFEKTGILPRTKTTEMTLREYAKFRMDTEPEKYSGSVHDVMEEFEAWYVKRILMAEGRGVKIRPDILEQDCFFDDDNDDDYKDDDYTELDFTRTDDDKYLSHLGKEGVYEKIAEKIPEPVRAFIDTRTAILESACGNRHLANIQLAFARSQLETANKRLFDTYIVASCIR